MSETKLVPVDTVDGLPAASCPITKNIFASVRIEAEVRRVLYALATPEYMEAWVQLPEVERIECHPEQRSFDRFRIDLLSAGQPQPSIYGSCLLCKPNRVTYLWERDNAGSRFRSVVEIHLLGAPNHCTLKLKHSGLSTESERSWHCAMWNQSLIKLCRLMEGIGFQFQSC